MKEDAKVWIYQSNKIFNDLECQQLQKILANFIQNWTAHNQQLLASFEIKYQRFLVLMVDETLASASGCSIDKSVHLMKQIEQEFNVDLFDRFHMAWKNREQVLSASREDFEKLIDTGEINADTIVFNNTVFTYKDYLNKWEIPFKDSWHTKVFKIQESH